MYEEDRVLSEVHIGTDCTAASSCNPALSHYTVVCTRFEFTIPSVAEELKKTKNFLSLTDSAFTSSVTGDHNVYSPPLSLLSFRSDVNSPNGSGIEPAVVLKTDQKRCLLCCSSSTCVHKQSNYEHQLPEHYHGDVPEIKNNKPSDVKAETCLEVNKGDSSLMTVAMMIDDDGDLMLERRQSYSHDVIIIEHAMDTVLRDVGLQVWSGCLLLCDYIINTPELFSHSSCVVELGAGTGLASCVAAMFNNNIICTDIGAEVLAMCRRNIENNLHSEGVTAVRVKQLDWTKSITNQGMIGEGFDLIDDDINMINSSPLIIASDVVYDDDLTEAFFKTVQRIMLSGPRITKTLIISLEKRICFTLADLMVSCPAYKKFSSLLGKLCNGEILFEQNDESSVSTVEEARYRKFTVDQILDCPQYFKYESSQYLELWRVTMDCL